MYFRRKLLRAVCALALFGATLTGAEETCQGEVCATEMPDAGPSMIVRGMSMDKQSVQSEDVAEDDDLAGGAAAGFEEEGPFYEDIEAAKAALLQSARSQEEAAREEHLKSFQALLDASLGADGVSVVADFKQSGLPCPSKSYLWETFVHADMETGTFVCKPCHASCTGHCSGPAKAECYSEPEELNLAGMSMRTSSRSDFANSFLRRLQAESLTQFSAGDMGRKPSTANSSLPANMSQCMEIGTCSVEETKVTESSSPNLSAVSVQLVMATSIKGDITDPTLLKVSVQRALNKELQDTGFIPGMTAEVPLEDALDNITDADEDGPPNTEADNSAGLMQPDSLLQSQRSCEEAMETRLNHTLKALSYHMKRRIKNAAKDHVRTEAKKRAKDYAKQSLKSWINAQEGDCLDALDTLIGASQHVYACFKDNYASLKTAFCDPPEKHRYLTEKLDGVVKASRTLKTISLPLKPLPYVGVAAKIIHRVAGKVQQILDPRVRTLKKMNVQQYGTWYEQQECCYPFPGAGCNHWPYQKYRCASCSSGGMCYLDRGCNTLNKLEEKVDQWKAQYYDPLLEKIAEATQNVQAANNAANQAANVHSWLARCHGGSFNMCSEVKALADKISGSIQGTFTDKYCPIKLPSIPFPSIDPIKTVLGWLGKISNVFGAINFELSKLHCVHVPKVEAWWERSCSRICTPCCSYHGRRRWVGGVRCSTCCHNVCVPVLRTRAYMKKYCFSAMNILKGIAGFLQTVLAPIFWIIEKAINVLLSPINALFDKILGMLGLNVNFPWPHIPNFEFNLPQLPAVNCHTLKHYVR